MQADLLITNARIVNGLGTPWFRGAVAARGGRIVAMGAEAATLSAAEVVDAQDRYLAPGFIDMHTHSDFDLLRSPDATGKLRQGVTSQAIGHCGYSAAPVCDENLALLDAYTGFLKAGVQPPCPWAPTWSASWATARCASRSWAFRTSPPAPRSLRPCASWPPGAWPRAPWA
jgi:N-acyl-D-amino-acid deacylase